jgi:signal transduction histidine kinase
MWRAGPTGSVAGMRTWRAGIGWVDIAIAAVVMAAMEIEVFTEDLDPKGAAVAMFAVQGGALVFRRTAPIPALLIGLLAGVAGTAAGVPLHTPVTPVLFVILLMYAVGLREPLPRAVAALVLGLALLATAMVIARHNGEAYDGTDIPWITLLASAPWFVGRAMRGRVRESEALERRAERLERERLAAVAEERARIARELHDVIAHSVSVMVVQAGAAEEVLKRDPARAFEPIRSVQETGRQALVEMSRLVGLLRDESHELGLTPQPRLHELPALVDQVREAGLPVELQVEGAGRQLPLGIELTAYRVVQEALTNALKHAGGARASVRVTYEPAAIELEVLDDGPGGQNGHVGGHGLAGMRERVSVFGGEMTAGPRPGGGFGVHVRLPLGDA